MVVYKDILYRYSRLIFLFRIFLVLKDYFLGNFLIEKERIYIQLYKNLFYIDVYSLYIIVLF